MPHLRMAYMCRRRLQRNLAMDRRGTYRHVSRRGRCPEEVNQEVEVDSPPSYGEEELGPFVVVG